MKLVVFFLAAAVLALSVLVGIQFNQNDQRVADINAARIESCRLTYEGVRQVFQPFFRPVKDRTPKENRNIHKFNSRIDTLKAGCVSQSNH